MNVYGWIAVAVAVIAAIAAIVAARRASHWRDVAERAESQAKGAELRARRATERADTATAERIGMGKATLDPPTAATPPVRRPAGTAPGTRSPRAATTRRTRSAEDARRYGAGDDLMVNPATSPVYGGWNSGTCSPGSGSDSGSSGSSGGYSGGGDSGGGGGGGGGGCD